MTRYEAILHTAQAGLWSPAGAFHIDPVRPVDTAVITHGHADHARPGHQRIYATAETLAIMEARYGSDFAQDTVALAYHEAVTLGETRLWLAPAGHVLGSAQVVVEKDDTRIVASGDYKREPDPTCAAFEPVPCDVFITEATFGLPVFRHPRPQDEIAKLLDSVRRFARSTHLVGVYALGKAQRLICELRRAGYDQTIFIHGALERLCRLYESHGVDLGPLANATLKDGNGKAHDFRGSIVLGPPSAFADKWARRFPDPIACFASGWMQVKARARQRGVELPLIISDHADWDDLIATIREVAPRELWITHGREEALARWAELQGLPARPLALVGYEDEGD